MAIASRAVLLPVRRDAHRLSDGLLVERVASGDDQAFEEILDRYGPGLLSFCAHMLGSREWGEDALQLTFVAAYKALLRGGCDGALRPWLYAIARNRCLSELRVHREIPDSDRVSAESPVIDDPARLFARRERLREIVEDIQRLPADQRAALVLFELGDHSHEEIATVLGVRREKVKALIFQAREGLCRGRSARESACSEVRERLANARGNAPARGVVRAHLDRCAACQEFEREVRGQRAALALVLPVALSGKLRALVLSSALGKGGVVAGSASAGAGGAGTVAGATTAGFGSGAAAGSGSLGAGAAASATGSASTAIGGGAVSAAAGTAAPTMGASALGAEAVAGVGALSSSVSAGTMAKLATVVAVAVGAGGVTHSAVTPSPRPPVSFLAGHLAQPAPLRSPIRPLVSGIVDPLATPTPPGPQPAAGAAPSGGAPTKTAGSAAAASSAANPGGVRAPSTPGAGSPSSPIGTTSAPTSSAPTSAAPGNGAAATTAPSSGSSTTTAATTTAATTMTAASTPTGSGTSTSTTTTASSSTTTSTGSSSSSSASQGTSGLSPGASGNSPGNSTSQGQSSGGSPGGGVTRVN